MHLVGDFPQTFAPDISEARYYREIRIAVMHGRRRGRRSHTLTVVATAILSGTGDDEGVVAYTHLMALIPSG